MSRRHMRKRLSSETRELGRISRRKRLLFFLTVQCEGPVTSSTSVRVSSRARMTRVLRDDLADHLARDLQPCESAMLGGIRNARNNQSPTPGGRFIIAQSVAGNSSIRPFPARI